MTVARAPSTGSSVLDGVAEAIGFAAALRLSRAFGGRQLYVPTSLPSDDPFTPEIGAEAAARLVEYFGGTTLTIPARPGRRALVIELSRDPNLTRQQIAEQAGVSDRAVYRILASADDRQGDLFPVI